MRIPLAISLQSRDGGTSRDAKSLNSIAEGDADTLKLRCRPGMSDIGLVKAATSQWLYVWNGINAIIGDFMNRGSITTIVPSPTQTNLTPTNAGLQFTGVATNDDAATPRLFFHNRSQGWTMPRGGAISAVTFGGTMGGNTYTLISLTRSGGTATATLTESPFNVGDSVTIAGAAPANYNGTFTVTAATAGSFTPAVVVPITSLTRVSGTATAVTSIPHELVNATTYTVSGADQSAYNIAATMTVVDPTTFTYTVTVTPGAGIAWNPADKAAAVTLSGSNLIATASSIAANAAAGVRGDTGKSGDKWYWEYTVNSVGDSNVGIYYGADKTAQSLTVGPTAGTPVSPDNFPIAGNVYGIALDMDSLQVTLYKNGALTFGPVVVTAGTYKPYLLIYNRSLVTSSAGAQVTANFGATAFAQTIPAGFSPLATDDPVSPATGSPVVTRPAITVNATFAYTVAGSPTTPATGTITAQTAGGIVPGVAYINGYFVVMDTNGVIWHSVSDDPTTWGALAFTTAQVENGEGRWIGKCGDSTLAAMKEWSTEFFYDAGTTPCAFQPVSNAFKPIGCASGDSVAYVSGAILWIAQSKEEGRSIYVMRGTDIQRISTPHIDRILEADNLATVYAYGIEMDGHPLYVLTLKTSAITLVYDAGTSMWGQWSSLTAGATVSITATKSGGTLTILTAGGSTTSPAVGDVVLLAGFKDPNYNDAFVVTSVVQHPLNSSTTVQVAVPSEWDAPAHKGSTTLTPYTESYFAFNKAASNNGQPLFLHETTGHLYVMESIYNQDGTAPIRFGGRTIKLDGGTTDLKGLASVALVGDTVDTIINVRWSDDDCQTFSNWRQIDLSSDQPITRRCGRFRRRTLEFQHIRRASPVIEAMELEIGK